MKFFDKLCLFLTCVTLVLFIFMCISNYLIGGNATNGYMEDGKYYVQNGVGENVPTSPILWYSNYSISLAFVILMPLGMLSLLYLWIKYVCMYIWLKKWEK